MGKSPYFTTPAARAYMANTGAVLVGVPESVEEPRRKGMIYWSSSLMDGLVEVLEIELTPCFCKTAKHKKACKGPMLHSIIERSLGDERMRPHFTPWDHKSSALVITPPKNVHGQAVACDERGWPNGSETWAVPA